MTLHSCVLQIFWSSLHILLRDTAIAFPIESSDISYTWLY